MHINGNGVTDGPRHVYASRIRTYEYVFPSINKHCIYSIAVKYAMLSLIGIEQQRGLIFS